MSAYTAWPLQVAIYDLLKVNTDITNIVPANKIADWIPETTGGKPTRTPYIQSGDSSETQGVLDTKDQQGVDHDFEILIVAKSSDDPLGANHLIKTVQQHIYDTLDRAVITLSDGFILELRYLNSSTNARDTNLKVGTMTFSAITSS